ncbi:helix-turn-helix domain-containing protein [Capnocytophaga canis]|uniref:DNA-binding helix-turn-helix protein n=1 Tax=Capnocytophaga canis TaxID=1848903 RepID=A0A0B7IRG8_9FLAO|nr:helix-turn-helix transcriptional regulator [Capnocytophaga canis]GIM62008.1 transcriptional regulator [Capnocytophaga canis]CEN54435.1 DNA-binding helix-turn-helix protein [Capnocytophaga canis]
MNRVKAFIERGSDGTFGVYVDLEDETLNYGIHGDGTTVEEAIEDFNLSYAEMKKIYEKDGKEFVEAVFEFQYDVASFLAYYGQYMSLAGLSRLTEVSQGQLSHYLNGHRNPSAKTTLKIQTKIQEFGKELQQLHFV